MAKKMKQEVDSPFEQIREWVMVSAKPLPRPRGRPRLISEAELIGCRDRTAGILESSWGEVGWDLKRSRTPADLLKAFRPLARHSYDYPLRLFMEERVSPCTSSDVRQTRWVLGRVSEEARRARGAYDRQSSLVKDATAALAQVEGNSEIREKVKTELEIRESELRRLAVILDTTRTREKNLEEKLHEQEAFFAQSELLEFIKSRRYAFTPRNVANAMAGLPYIGWRRSFQACAKSPCVMAVAINYQVFEAVCYVLKNTKPSSTAAALRLFRTQVRKLPRKHERAQSHLIENWIDMKEAIEECWKVRIHPGALPYRLTALFAKNLIRPRSALDRVLAAIELRKFEGSNTS